MLGGVPEEEVFPFLLCVEVVCVGVEEVAYGVAPNVLLPGLVAFYGYVDVECGVVEEALCLHLGARVGLAALDIELLEL